MDVNNPEIDFSIAGSTVVLEYGSFKSTTLPLMK